MTSTSCFRYIRIVLFSASIFVSLFAGKQAEAQTASFNIPAEDATTAIPEFARQAGLQIIAPADQVKGIKTQAIQGSMDVHVALKQLLEGTGLAVTSDDGRTISLKVQDKGVASVHTTAQVDQLRNGSADAAPPVRV